MPMSTMTCLIPVFCGLRLANAAPGPKIRVVPTAAAAPATPLRKWRRLMVMKIAYSQSSGHARYFRCDGEREAQPGRAVGVRHALGARAVPPVARRRRGGALATGAAVGADVPAAHDRAQPGDDG